MPIEGYMSVQEAAARIKTVRKGGVCVVGGHPTLIYRFIRRKQLKAVRWNKRWWIRKEDFEKFNRTFRKHGLSYKPKKSKVIKE